MLGTLAITGVGIAGVAGFAGFYSKDGILEAAFASGGGGVIAFWVGIFVAFLTSFYSWRLVFLTFYGKPRWEQSAHIQHAVHGEHEDPSEEHSGDDHAHAHRSEEHTSELQSLMRISYAVFCLKKKPDPTKKTTNPLHHTNINLVL